MRGYLPLIRKDSGTHMHGLAVSVKKDFLLDLSKKRKKDLSLENSAHSYLCFRLALLHSVSSSFSSINHLLHLCGVFNSISSNIDEILSINPSANVFVFGDFNVHHNNWVTYSGGTDQPGELL